MPTGGRFNVGVNLTVVGLMGVTVVSGDSLEGEPLMAPARSSEKDLKVEELGLEATGLATTVLSASLISIFDEYLKYVFKVFGAPYVVASTLLDETFSASYVQI